MLQRRSSSSLEDDTISSQKGRRPRRRLMAKSRPKEPRRTSPLEKMRHVVLGESLGRTAGCFDEVGAEPMARSSE